jgi:mevalonate kinase
MHDHSHLTMPEQVAIKAFLHVVGQALEENKTTTTLDDLSTKYAFKLKIDFEFPQGSGLGSSASFNVVLAGAVYTVVNKLLWDSLKDQSDLIFDGEDELWKIKTLADYGEGFLHKNASGVDTSVVTLGGMIRFVKSQDAASFPKSKFGDFGKSIFWCDLERCEVWI